jgi:hypothetical protein
MVPTRQTSAHRRTSTPVVGSPLPTLIVWTLTLVALSWWPSPRLPRRLPGVVEGFYTPRVTFLVLAGLTLLVGWSARGDRYRMWSVIGASVLFTVMYLLLLV